MHPYTHPLPSLLQLGRLPKTQPCHDARIPIPSRDAPIHRLPDLLLILGTQHDIQLAHILQQILLILRAGDGQHITPLSQQPRQRQLTHHTPLPLRNLRQTIHQL